MKKIYLISALVAVLAPATAAQNLNPQVQVTNVYESEAPDVRKQDLPVSVPDSIMHFDYVFDYSVFDSPYRGAYEFNPYEIRMVPEKIAQTPGVFSMKAGAGYTVHPVLDAVWTPVAKSGLQWEVRQNLGGYTGSYWQPADDLGLFEEKYSGYDLEEKISVGGRLPLSGSILTFEALYDGIFTSDFIQDTDYHSALVRARLKSTALYTGSFVYDVNFSGRYGCDNVPHAFGPLAAQETDFRLYGSLGTMLNTVDRLLVDYEIRYDRMYGSFDGSVINDVTLAPHIILQYDSFDFDLGFRMDYISKVTLHPQVRVNWAAVKDVLNVYAGVKGAQNVLTYGSLKQYDHYFNPAYNEDFQSVENEKLNVYLGLRGFRGPHFNYSFEAGWASYSGSPFETVSLDSRSGLRPGIGYFDYSVLFADLGAGWKSERFEADASLKLRKTSLTETDAAANLPLVSAAARARYNWLKRLYLGIGCEIATERRFTVIGGSAVSIPFTADLSASCRYEFNSKWGVWLRGGNLLNQFIYTTPLHVEQGINFTAGICLSL